MPSEHRRSDRVAEAIREEIATFLAADAKDPRISRLDTVTGCRRHARPPARQGVRERDGDGRRARRDVRGTGERRRPPAVARRVARCNCASRPEITFAPDESIARAARIESLLAQIKEAAAVRRRPRLRSTPMGTPTSEAGGLLLVDKPAGVTSHDVVAIVRRALHTRRVGHTGTLDPFATGLLLVLIGRGTRLIPYVEQEPKVYEATIRFGAETEHRRPHRRRDALGAAARATRRSTTRSSQLSGRLEQLPPAFSAKQVDGKRAYAAARRARRSSSAPVPVTVHAWEHSRARRRHAHGAHHVRRRHVHSRARARPRTAVGQRGASRVACAAPRPVRSPWSDAATLDDVQRGACDAAAAGVRGAVAPGAAARRGRARARRARQRRGVCAPRRRASRSSAMMILSSRSPRPTARELRPKLVLRDALSARWGFPQLAGGSVVTVGTFDGVHAGHRDIVRRLSERAAARGLPAVLVTFRPHPLEVVNPSAAPMLLTPDDEQLDALADSGSVLVVVLPFTRRARSLLRRRLRVAAAARPLPHARDRHRLRPRARARPAGRRHACSPSLADRTDSTSRSCRRRSMRSARRSRRAPCARRSRTAISSVRARRLAARTACAGASYLARSAVATSATRRSISSCRRRANFCRPTGYTRFAPRRRAARSAA